MRPFAAQQLLDPRGTDAPARVLIMVIPRNPLALDARRWDHGSMSAGWLAWFFAYGAFALLWPGWSGPAHPQPGYAWFLLLVLAPWSVWLVLRCARRGSGELLAVLLAGCVQLVVIYPAHVLTTGAKDWAYFEDVDRLLGIRYAGVPVEEFFFYPLTINLTLLMYLVLRDRFVAARIPDFRPPRARLRAGLGIAALACFAVAAWVWTRRDLTVIAPALQLRDAAGVPSYAEGPLHRGWALLCLISAGGNLLWLWWTESRTGLSLRAVALAAPVFVAMSLLIDLLGVSRGWWVFNAQACSGAWIGPLPAEELPMYVTGVMLSASLYEWFRRWLGGGRPR